MGAGASAPLLGSSSAPGGPPPLGPDLDAERQLGSGKKQSAAFRSLPAPDRPPALLGTSSLSKTKEFRILPGRLAMFPAMQVSGGTPEESIDLPPDLLVFNIEGRKGEMGAPGQSPGLTLCVSGARTGTRLLLDAPQQTLEWHAAIVLERDRKYVHFPDSDFSDRVRAEFWAAFPTKPAGRLLRELYFACDSDRRAPAAAVLKPALQSLLITFKQLLAAAAAEKLWGGGVAVAAPPALDAAAAKAFVELLAIAASEPCIRALLLALKVSSALPAYLQNLRHGDAPPTPPAAAAAPAAVSKKTAKVAPAPQPPVPVAAPALPSGFPKSPAEAVASFVRWLRSHVWGPKWVQPPPTFILTLLDGHPAASDASSRMWAAAEGAWLERVQFGRFPPLALSHCSSLVAPGPWLGAFALLCADAGDIARLQGALDLSPEVLVRQALSMSVADAQGARRKHSLAELLFHKNIMTPAGRPVRDKLTALLCAGGTLDDDSLSAYVRFALHSQAQDALLSLLRSVFFTGDGSLNADVLESMGSPAKRITEELAAFLRPADDGASGATARRVGEWSRSLLEITMRLEASSAFDASPRIKHLETLAQSLLAEPQAGATLTPQARLGTLRGRVTFLLFVTDFTSRFAAVCAPNASFFPAVTSGKAEAGEATGRQQPSAQSLISQWGDALATPSGDDNVQPASSARRAQAGQVLAQPKKADWRRDWATLVNAPFSSGASDAPVPARSASGTAAAAAGSGVLQSSSSGSASASGDWLSGVSGGLGAAARAASEGPADPAAGGELLARGSFNSGGSSSASGELAPGMRADNPHARQRNALLDAIFGLLSLTLATDPLVTVFFLERPGLEAFFSTYLQPGGPLRERLLHLLQTRHGCLAALCEMARSGDDILTHASHLSPPVLQALAMSPRGVPPPLHTDLVACALKLREVSDTLPVLLERAEEAAAETSERLAQLELLVAEVRRRPAAFFVTGPPSDLHVALSFEDLGACAGYMTDALLLLSGAPDGRGAARLRTMFSHYLEKKAPETWLGHFKAAETVATFIKYMDRENLGRAYERFEALNAARPVALGLIAAVRAEYGSPLVRVDDIPMDAGDAALLALIDTLECRADGAPTPVLGILVRLFAAWMRDRHALCGLPLLPRNAQVIAALVLVSWAQSLPEKGGKRVMIGQVGTGEGKSLITAMLAVFAVRVLNKRVHVLENNVGLLDRDYSDFEPFFRRFDISCSKNFDDAAAAVIYCTQEHLDHWYRDSVFKGKLHLNNFVLVVDEVDELIVDRDPNNTYVKAESAEGPALSRCFDALRGGASARMPDGVRESTWQWALRAYQQAQSMRLDQPNGYTIGVGGELKSIDSNCRQTGYWSPGLEFRSYEVNGRTPSLQSHFFFQSKPHMLMQYSAIVGLSGSLGSPSEKEFLSRTYGADFFDVPPFIDTCVGASKYPPRLVDDAVSVLPTVAEQYAAVAELALRKCSSVPVVIIAKNSIAAAALHAEIKGRAAAALGLRGEEEAGSLVQLFVETTEGQRAAVERATTPFERGPYDAVYRVTVTEYWGGRGHDYRVKGRDVDERGGLLVIATEIPVSEREWVQWKGRTARSDHPGQYAVVLCAAEEPCRSSAGKLAEHRVAAAAAAPSSGGNGDGGGGGLLVTAYRPTLIPALLQVRDEEQRAKLAGLGPAIRRGLQLAELCDKFYARHADTSGRWPANDAQRRLRDFLFEKRGSATAAEVAAFAASVDLAPSAAAYQAASQHCDTQAAKD